MTAAIDCFVDVSGRRLHYLRAGYGLPLVLLHSNGASAHEFEHVVGPLAKRASVHCVDYPGFGDSEALPGRFSIEATTDAIGGFVRSLALDRPVLCGTSIGGTIAADFASRYPDLIRGVVLVETPCRSWEAWGRIWPVVERLFAIPTQQLDQIEARFRAATPELLTRWNIDRNKCGGRVMMEAMWAIREFDMRAAAARIDLPCLLIFGENGAVADGADDLCTSIPSATRVDLADCGHFPMIDDPAAFSAALVEFLAR